MDSDINKIRKIIQRIILTSRYVDIEQPINIAVDQTWQNEIICFRLTVQAHIIDPAFEKDFKTDAYIRATKELNLCNINTPARGRLSPLKGISSSQGVTVKLNW